MNTAQEARGDKTGYRPKHYANSPFPSTKGRFHQNHSFLSLMESIYQETVFFFFWFIISRRHLREEYLPTYNVPKFYRISETIVHTITHMFMHVIHNKVFRNVPELPQDQNDKAPHVSCVLLSDSNLTKFTSSLAPIPLLPRLTLCYIFIFSASTKWQQEVLRAPAVDLNRNCGAQLGLGKGRDFPGKVRRRSSTLYTISYETFGVWYCPAWICPGLSSLPRQCLGWGWGLVTRLFKPKCLWVLSSSCEVVNILLAIL